jgi:hypothetical protein
MMKALLFQKAVKEKPEEAMKALREEVMKAIKIKIWEPVHLNSLSAGERLDFAANDQLPGEV